MEEQKRGNWKIVIWIFLIIGFSAFGFYLGFNDTFNLKEDDKVEDIKSSDEDSKSNLSQEEIVLKEKADKISRSSSFISAFESGLSIDEQVKNSLYLNFMFDFSTEIENEEEAKYEHGLYSRKITYDDVSNDYNKYFTGKLLKENNYDYDYKNNNYYLKVWGRVTTISRDYSDYEFICEEEYCLVSYYVYYYCDLVIYSDSDGTNAVESFDSVDDLKNFKITVENKDKFSKITLKFVRDEENGFLFDTATMNE